MNSVILNNVTPSDTKLIRRASFVTTDSASDASIIHRGKSHQGYLQLLSNNSHEQFKQVYVSLSGLSLVCFQEDPAICIQEKKDVVTVITVNLNGSELISRPSMNVPHSFSIQPSIGSTVQFSCSTSLVKYKWCRIIERNMKKSKGTTVSYSSSSSGSSSGNSNSSSSSSSSTAVNSGLSIVDTPLQVSEALQIVTSPESSTSGTYSGFLSPELLQEFISITPRQIRESRRGPMGPPLIMPSPVSLKAKAVIPAAVATGVVKQHRIVTKQQVPASPTADRSIVWNSNTVGHNKHSSKKYQRNDTKISSKSTERSSENIYSNTLSSIDSHGGGKSSSATCVTGNNRFVDDINDSDADIKTAKRLYEYIVKDFERNDGKRSARSNGNRSSDRNDRYYDDKQYDDTRHTYDNSSNDCNTSIDDVDDDDNEYLYTEYFNNRGRSHEYKYNNNHSKSNRSTSGKIKSIADVIIPYSDKRRSKSLPSNTRNRGVSSHKRWNRGRSTSPQSKVRGTFGGSGGKRHDWMGISRDVMGMKDRETYLKLRTKIDNSNSSSSSSSKYSSRNTGDVSWKWSTIQKEEFVKRYGKKHAIAEGKGSGFSLQIKDLMSPNYDHTHTVCDSRTQHPMHPSHYMYDTYTNTANGSGKVVDIEPPKCVNYSPVRQPMDTSNSTASDAAQAIRLNLWLESINMSKYVDVLYSNGVNKLSILELLQLEDLLFIGIIDSDATAIMQLIRDIASSTTATATALTTNTHTPVDAQLLIKQTVQSINSPSRSNLLSDSTITRSNQDACVKHILQLYHDGSATDFFLYWYNSVLQMMIQECRPSSLALLPSSTYPPHYVALKAIELHIHIYFIIKAIKMYMIGAVDEHSVAQSYHFFELSIKRLASLTQLPILRSEEFALFAGFIFIPDPVNNAVYAPFFADSWAVALKDRLLYFLGIAIPTCTIGENHRTASSTSVTAVGGSSETVVQHTKTTDDIAACQQASPTILDTNAAIVTNTTTAADAAANVTAVVATATTVTAAMNKISDSAACCSHCIVTDGTGATAVVDEVDLSAEVGMSSTDKVLAVESVPIEAMTTAVILTADCIDVAASIPSVDVSNEDIKDSEGEYTLSDNDDDYRYIQLTRERSLGGLDELCHLSPSMSQSQLSPATTIKMKELESIWSGN